MGVGRGLDDGQIRGGGGIDGGALIWDRLRIGRLTFAAGCCCRGRRGFCRYGCLGRGKCGVSSGRSYRGGFIVPVNLIVKSWGSGGFGVASGFGSGF